ncbi:MAG: DUF1847 domain-containing protein [Deltaproteobacteria bacterium]|nr:DUF1847 domain-containing protein [Deltaproteobacteria bacterium]
MSCQQPDGKGGAGCPTLSGKELVAAARAQYKGDTREFARQAAIQEAECYAGREEEPQQLIPTKSRIVEICEFAEKMGFKKLGLAFCIRSMKEATIVADFFEGRGFEVVSVVCKAGGVPKERIGIEESEKLRIGTYEAMCNPIMQAKVLNHAGTQFNVVMGLCVGHDSLLFKNIEAPCTVLVVKDRINDDNPAAAIRKLGR